MKPFYIISYQYIFLLTLISFSQEDGIKLFGWLEHGSYVGWFLGSEHSSFVGLALVLKRWWLIYSSVRVLRRWLICWLGSGVEHNGSFVGRLLCRSFIFILSFFYSVCWSTSNLGGVILIFFISFFLFFFAFRVLITLGIVRVLLI